MIHRWVRRVAERFEDDPEFQVRFHVKMMEVWEAMTAVVVLAYFFLPGIWLKVSILYVIIISHYANWATDYDAVSASKAFLHAKRAEEK